MAAALATSGCLTQELDGTWRQPASDRPRPVAYELALGQYGPEVAGLVRSYQGLGDGEAADPYLVEVHCSTIEDGAISGDKLRFRFRDAEGASFLASLTIGEERNRLEGNTIAEDGALRVVRFMRESANVDRGCGDFEEPMVVHGVVHVDGAPLGERVRVALAFSGQGEAGTFLAPWKVVTPDRTGEGAPTFTFEITTLPDSRYFGDGPTDGSVRFAYAVFLAFEDLDDDGRWDQGYFADDAEPLVGVAPDRALAYLEGRGGAAFPDRPELAGGLDPGYSLVAVVREGAGGPVERLDRVEMEEIVQVIVPAGAADVPLLDAE